MLSETSSSATRRSSILWRGLRRYGLPSLRIVSSSAKICIGLCILAFLISQWPIYVSCPSFYFKAVSLDGGMLHLLHSRRSEEASFTIHGFTPNFKLWDERGLFDGGPGSWSYILRVPLWLPAVLFGFTHVCAAFLASRIVDPAACRACRYPRCKNAKNMCPECGNHYGEGASVPAAASTDEPAQE